jgi:hypothetical protein
MTLSRFIPFARPPLLPLVIADANVHGVRRSDRSVVRMLQLRAAVMTLR